MGATPLSRWSGERFAKENGERGRPGGLRRGRAGRGSADRHYRCEQSLRYSGAPRQADGWSNRARRRQRLSSSPPLHGRRVLKVRCRRPVRPRPLPRNLSGPLPPSSRFFQAPFWFLLSRFLHRRLRLVFSQLPRGQRPVSPHLTTCVPISDPSAPQILFLFHSLVCDRPLCLLLGGWCADLRLCALGQISLAPLVKMPPVPPPVVMLDCHHFSCVRSQCPPTTALLTNFLSLCRHHRLLGPTLLL